MCSKTLFRHAPGKFANVAGLPAFAAPRRLFYRLMVTYWESADKSLPHVTQNNLIPRSHQTG